MNKEFWNCQNQACERDYKPYDKAGSRLTLPFDTCYGSKLINPTIELGLPDPICINYINSYSWRCVEKVQVPEMPLYIGFFQSRNMDLINFDNCFYEII